MQKHILTFLKGMAMGACDVVPGVSGGTVAFITGIYDRLLSAIKSFDISVLKLLSQGKIRQARQQVDGRFLLALFGGIAVSILSLAKGLSRAMEVYPHRVWGFFFGLVVASIILLMRDVRRRSPQTIIALVIGALVAYGITQITPTAIDPTWWMIIISAMIAISAMILPGISGSFILLLLGMYQHVIAAVTDRNLIFLGLFAGGAVVGLMSFSRVVSRAFRHYQQVTMATLIGFMIGALPKLRPRQNTLTTTLDRHGQEVTLTTANVLPLDYVGSADLRTVIGLCIIGIVVPLLLTYIAKRHVS